MKKLPLILCACLALVACTTPVIFTGCVTQTTVAPGSDPYVVNLEQTYRIAFELADGFLDWEYQNRATIPYSVTEFADKVRKEFPPRYERCKALVREYKQNRASVDYNALEIARLALQEIVTEIRLYAPSSVENAAEKKANQ